MPALSSLVLVVGLVPFAELFAAGRRLVVLFETLAWLPLLFLLLLLLLVVLGAVFRELRALARLLTLRRVVPFVPVPVRVVSVAVAVVVPRPRFGR